MRQDYSSVDLFKMVAMKKSILSRFIFSKLFGFKAIDVSANITFAFFFVENFLLPVEDLEKSDESWRQQVEELKQSNPLVTAARRMLNKVTNDTLELFTKKLVEVLQEAQQEGREVMTAAVESFTAFLFKKASVDNNHRKLYAKLLCVPPTFQF